MTTAGEVSELAARVVEHLQSGLRVRTQEAQFWSTTPDDEVLRDIAVSARIEVSVERLDRSVDVRTTYVIDALRRAEESEDEGGEHAPEGWHSSVVLHGQWHAHDVYELSDAELRAFAVRVGVMTLHPYARTQIQAAVASAGWPTYTLDVLTPQDQLFVSDDEPGQVDLSLVTLY